MAWCTQVLEGSLGQPIKRQKQIELSLIDHEGQRVFSWTFDNAYPVKWSVDPSRTNKCEVALEMVEFAYTAAVRAS